MMKKVLSILLALSLLLPGFAAAEAAAPAYVPGSIINALFAEAFDSGMLVCAEVDLELALNAEKLGIPAEDAAIADATIEVINNAVFSGGAAKTDDGLMLTLGTTYAKEGAETAPAASLRVYLNRDGFHLETSLLPGERVSGTWETLLKMAGVDDATIAQLLSLRDLDPEMLMAQIEQTAAQVLPMVSQVAAPYLNIMTDFVSNLPFEVEEDIAAEGYFPAAKQEVTYVLTVKAMGELITQLADQLAADPTLSALLNMVLTNSEIMGENTMTTAALCENIRAAAAGMTDEATPILFFIGYDEAGVPLYACASCTGPDGTSLAANLVNTTENPAEGTGFIVDLFMIDAAEVYTGAALSVFSRRNAADENDFDLSVIFEAAAQNTPVMSVEFTQSSAPMTTEENLPGYSGHQVMSMSMNIPEQDASVAVNVVSSVETQQHMTADGGEELMTYGVTDTYAGDTTAKNTVETYFAAIPTEEGPVGRFAEALTQPETGIDSLLFDVYLCGVPFEVEERTLTLDIGAAAEQDLNDMVMRLTTNALEYMDALTAQLPPVLVEAMTAAPEAPAAM